MANRRFQFLDDSGGDSKKNRRTSIEPDCDVLWLDSLKDGKRRRMPERVPRFKVKAVGKVFEDMPWCGMAFVVSDRLRKFLQKEAKGHAQFFEAELTGKKSVLALAEEKGPFFVVNWLKMVDCIDLKKSEYDLDEDEGEEPDYTFYTIKLAPKKVPAAALIFRLKHECTSTVIDEELAKKMQKAGFVGPQFGKVQGIMEAMR